MTSAPTSGSPDPAPGSAPPPGGPSTEPRERNRLGIWTAIAVAIIVLGAVIGWFVGGSIADGNADDDRAAAERASEQEDDARDRRDLLDARLVYLDQQAKALPKVGTSKPLLASAKTSADVELGTKFSVDGGSYVVRGLQVLDTFTSKDPQRPTTERDGYRWALVELDYTNVKSDDPAPPCGTMGVVHLVLGDRTAVAEVDASDEKPPVANGTYALCGTPAPRGKAVRWFAPVRVPEGATITGILIADVYARTSDSQYNVQSGKQAWLPLDEAVDVGKQGDNEITERFVEEDS